MYWNVYVYCDMYVYVYMYTCMYDLPRTPYTPWTCVDNTACKYKAYTCEPAYKMDSLSEYHTIPFYLFTSVHSISVRPPGPIVVLIL